MKCLYKNKILVLGLSASLGLTSCIDETIPTSVITAEQLANMESSQEGLLQGIVSFMTAFDSWGSGGDYTNDWGYPCQMFFRDILGADIPVYNSSYSYWYNIESGTETRYTPYYTYKYYYMLIKNCNNLISVIKPEEASETSLQYLGCALTFRALAYFDIARMFEFKKTGLASLDSKAESDQIWDLTLPIVTESTTLEETKNNPRAPFAKMYRFILTDLNNAEKYLAGYRRDTKTLPDLSVVYGLKARYYLELGSRFEEKPEDLETVKKADAENTDGYDAIGVNSAAECFQKAKEYAQKAQSGYSILTSEQWHDKNTGFNKINDAWMWGMSFTTKEQLGTYYWDHFTAVVSTEADWSMGRGYDAYRCIGSSLFARISDNDWRKTSWIAPGDANNASAYSKYETLLSEENWKLLPEYANLKFRPGSGNLDDYNIGELVDIPLMRVEEMKFIEIEATAHLNGVEAGRDALKEFINTYRYVDNADIAYTPDNIIKDMNSFNAEMMVQKRIEFWGEGITYFDYKRLNLQVRRSDNTNCEDAFQLNSIQGYTAPWMNFYILEYETNLNAGIIPNPDTSGSITASK